MNHYAQPAALRSCSLGFRVAAFVAAAWAAAGRGINRFPGRDVAWRNVDAVDGLDERTLRDIGVGEWTAARDATRDHDALRARLYTGFGG
jgi:hypothetical protein